MGKQVIITISREYGSGGHEIGNILANALGIQMYDRSLIKEIAKELNMDVEVLKKYDEKPKNRILTRTVGSHSNSMEDILTEREEAWVRSRADSGESFIVVGRRAKEILEGNPNVISIFITADEDYKVHRIMEDRAIDEATARAERVRVDKLRKTFHNRYSDYKWGDSRYYDIVINSSRLGSFGTAAELIHYIRSRVIAVGAEELVIMEKVMADTDKLRIKVTEGADPGEMEVEIDRSKVDEAIAEMRAAVKPGPADKEPGPAEAAKTE